MGEVEEWKKDRNNPNIREIRWMLLNVVGDRVAGDKLEVGVDSLSLSVEKPKFRPRNTVANSPKSCPR